MASSLGICFKYPALQTNEEEDPLMVLPLGGRDTVFSFFSKHQRMSTDTHSNLQKREYLFFLHKKFIAQN
jgi:hypothetical protein